MIRSLSVQSNPRLVNTRTPLLSMTIWQRQPSNFTSVSQSSAPGGGLSTKVGIIGSMNAEPAGHTFPHKGINLCGTN